jgi:hypothetical protein
MGRYRLAAHGRPSGIAKIFLFRSSSQLEPLLWARSDLGVTD